MDPRLIPGGRLDAPAIGVNAVDRDDLPSEGVANPQVDFFNTPVTAEERPPEPGADAPVIPETAPLRGARRPEVRR